MPEMPTITGSTYTSNAVNMQAYAANGLGAAGQLGGVGAAQDYEREHKIKALYLAQGNVTTVTSPKQEKTPMSARRLVQVFIADPNDNVPLDQSLLYSGDQKFTDATDQELFFEIDITTILKAYNEKRVKVVDKKVKERTEYLEAAKIRDLKMVVVTVASF